MKKVFRAAELVAVLFLASLIALLPQRMAKGAGKISGLLLFWLWGQRRRVAIENIRESRRLGALGAELQPEGTARKSFENLGISATELVKVYYGLGGTILDRIEMHGLENLKRAKEAGRGVILLTAHAGNWELMALKYSRDVEKAGVVARPLNNPFLNRVVENSREKFGNEIIPKGGALKKLLRLLKQGGTAGVLVDQAVIKEEGLIIKFMGRGAWTSRMPYLLAKRTGAAVIPAFIRRTDKGHEITIYPEVDISGTEEEVLGRFNAAVEAHIKANPAEWLWLHKRWKRVGEAGPIPQSALLKTGEGR